MFLLVVYAEDKGKKKKKNEQKDPYKVMTVTQQETSEQQ